MAGRSKHPGLGGARAAGWPRAGPQSGGGRVVSALPTLRPLVGAGAGGGGSRRDGEPRVLTVDHGFAASLFSPPTGRCSRLHCRRRSPEPPLAGYRARGSGVKGAREITKGSSMKNEGIPQSRSRPIRWETSASAVFPIGFWTDGRAEAPRLRSAAPWRSARRRVVDGHPAAVALRQTAICFVISGGFAPGGFWGVGSLIPIPPPTHRALAYAGAGTDPYKSGPVAGRAAPRATGGRCR